MIYSRLCITAIDPPNLLSLFSYAPQAGLPPVQLPPLHIRLHLNHVQSGLHQLGDALAPLGEVLGSLGGGLGAGDPPILTLTYT